MKKSYIILAIIGTLLLVGVGGCISLRNGIVKAGNTVDEAWGNVESAYQRRLDLIPNLVNTVKGYAEHESTTFQNVTNARVGLKSAYDAAEAAMNTEGTPNEQQMQNLQQTSSEMMRQAGLYINAVHEAYPTLRANENFNKLQDELAGTENRINTERTRYNEAVKEYNNRVMTFPGSLLGFEKKASFKADAAASKAPVVDFGNSTPTVNDF